MSGNSGDTEPTVTTDRDGDLTYVRFDKHSTPSTCTSIVLSSCSSDEENVVKHSVPTLKWKRQKILNNDYHNPLAERPSSGSDVLNNLHVDRNLAISANENVIVPLDEERRSIPPRRLPPIPEDKLHRRNPHTVRQEIRMFDDDLIPETSLADVHLSEMPGLHNTEQWKRIADRTVHASPPLSRQYYQTVVSTVESQNGQVPQPFGSYRRPGRSENEEEDRPTTPASPWRVPRRRIFFGSSVAVVIVAIVVAVVLAITLIRKTGQATTDYYSGSVYVSAKFDQALFDLSSSLAKSHKRQFCSLIGTTLADTKTKYALFYSSCTVNAFRNGSIIVDFTLGFTRSQNVTRLNLYLTRTLVNKSLFDGTIISVVFNVTLLDQNNSNNTNSTDDYDGTDYNDDSSDDDNDDDIAKPGKLIMAEQNLTNDQPESARTTYTTVTYTKLEKGLSITISETITITNNNNNSFDKSSINNQNYELILVPTIDNTKTIVIPTNDTHEKSLLSTPLPPPSQPVTTTNLIPKSPTDYNLLQPIKPYHDPNFAYIDESSDDRTFSSGDGTSTLGDLTTRDSSTSDSTISLHDETLMNSTSTLVNNPVLSTNRPVNRNPPPMKDKTEISEDKRPYPSRPNTNIIKRQRRMIQPKNQRRLLQYELMPTGKVYYVDRPFYKENPISKGDKDENSSMMLSTILSRSSSLDTLSDKHHRHQNRKSYQDFTLKKPEQKISIGGRLASNNTLPISSPFKPINTNKKKRFSSFEPTPESLDRVLDVLVAADKRREENEFWKEKFDHRQSSSRVPLVPGRIHEPPNTHTIPFPRTKQPQLISNNTGRRSQSYTTKRNSLYEAYNQQSGCLLEDCLRKRTLLLQQQAQRNYSPNTIYSTNYPKQQLLPTSKPSLPTTTNQQPVRILPLPNGRISRAPQARQTSDELSSVSDIWATRSSFEDESHHPKRPSNHARFQSTVNHHRPTLQKPTTNKRASSVEQQKSHRTATKNLSTAKNKFFDLFKFTR